MGRVLLVLVVFNFESSSVYEKCHLSVVRRAPIPEQLIAVSVAIALAGKPSSPGLLSG